MEREVYLKPNVVFEPLVNQWYAWSHLISPATLALNIQRRHFTIMQSYIDNPEIHRNAASNPKMKGGPFMDFKENSVDRVTALLQKTLEENTDLLQLADAIQELDALLRNQNKGVGLDEIYQKVPTILRGLVELYYDRNHHADFRFFEPLLYQSDFYKAKSQGVALWLTENDERPFVLSTPRFEDHNSVYLDLAFNRPEIDLLAKMKWHPSSYDRIQQVLGIKTEQKDIFQTFFTDEPPRPYNRYTGDKVRMRYMGHACILIETREVSILLDPLLSYYGYLNGLDRFSDMDLPPVIDYVVITHNHQDHILFETLLPIRHKIGKVIVPRTYGGKLEDPNLKLMLNSIGFNNVVEVGEMDLLQFDDISVQALPFTGEHCDLDILTKACYFIKIGNFKLLFFADSKATIPEMYERVHSLTGDVDVMFLGMECDGAPLSWLYGPLLTQKLTRVQDQSRRLAGSNCKEGIKLVNIFNPKEVYVYAMGLEPWLEFITTARNADDANPIVQSNQLIRECREMGLVSERLYGEKEILYDKNIVPGEGVLMV
ncbi:MAG: MBL fold metallo-hydrolase [Chryseotalea sp. WA131a]|nr:MAG: MBL fold metallo-hydrolase [Chryseotalea sp. WA131a]